MDALDLLFRRLVVTANAANALARVLDIGEILDKLVPYKAARRDGALETHEDYLHTMMRLVAGERDYVFADDLLQDDLRNELKSPNPDLGVLRTYLNAGVRLSTEAVQRVLAGDTNIDIRPSTPIASAVVQEALAAPATPVAAGAPLAPAPVAATAKPATASTTTATPATPADTEFAGCPYCNGALPAARAAKYCPHCGINLTVRRCPGCSSEIESEWKFCVTCGRSAA